MQVLIVVTHLLGAGHLRRAINLADAFAGAGHKVTLVSGGRAVAQFATGNINLIQLPPVQSDGANFAHLLDAEGKAVSERYLSSRQNLLSALVGDLQPDIVITELYPFGRRVLKAEFQALLESCLALKATPTILASVRDILAAPSSNKKALQTEQIIEQYYDAVLVHSDKAITPLEESWPVSEKLSAKLHYTGYVVQQFEHAADSFSAQHKAEVLISAGAGSVGALLFEVAVKAAQLSDQFHWRLLVGGADADDEIRRLSQFGPDQRVTIENLRPDFQQLLQAASASVSMCGYNTAVDLLQSGTPAVFVPFEDNGEIEQLQRARSLARQPIYSLLRTKQLSPDTLLAAVKDASTRSRDGVEKWQFNGAAESVRFAVEMAENKI